MDGASGKHCQEVAGVSRLLHHVVVAFYFLYDPVLKIGCRWDCYGWLAGETYRPIAGDYHLQVIGNSDRRRHNHLDKQMLSSPLTHVPVALVDALVYHSDEIQVGGTLALDVAHSFGSLFHSEDGTSYTRGWHLPNQIHGHSELAYEDLQNRDNLHENNLFLVVKFHSVHDCAAHLNRKSVVGRRELQNKVVVGRRELQNKVVVGYAYDCHSHCDLSSVVDYWKLVDVMPPQDDGQRWFQGDFVCHSPKAASQNPHAIKLVQVSDHLDLPSFWGI